MQRSLPLFVGLTAAFVVIEATGSNAASDPGKPVAERMKERDRYFQAAVQADEVGRWQEAVAAAEQALAVDRQLAAEAERESPGGSAELSARRSRLEDSLRWLHARYVRREEFAAARRVLLELVTLLEKERGQDDWGTNDMRRALADVERLAALTPAQRQQVTEATELTVTAAEALAQGQFAVAARGYEQALRVWEGIFGAEHHFTARTLGDLGNVEVARGHFTGAEPHLQRALQIKEKVLGANHPETALAAHSLAAVYVARRDYPQAAKLYQRAWQILAKALGPDLPDTACLLTEYAKMLMAQYAYREALPHLRHACEVFEKSLGPNHPDTIAALSNLGSVLEALGAYDEAAQCHQRALASQEQVSGRGHPDTVPHLSNLGSVYQAQGNLAGAGKHYQQVLDIQTQARGLEHPDTATALGNLGGLYVNQGEWAKAAPLLRRALKILEDPKNGLGPDHPATAIILSNLGCLHRAVGDYAEAAALLQRALAIHERAASPAPRELAVVLSNLGCVQADLGNCRQAAVSLQRALVILEKILGPDHPATAIARSNLGCVYANQGGYAQATEHFERAKAILERAFTADHPATVTAKNNLGCVYRVTGCYAAAEPLLEHALAVSEKMLGEQHPLTGDILLNLGYLYHARGDATKALPLLQRALAIARQQMELAAAVQSERQQLAMVRSLRHCLDAYLSLMLVPESGVRAEDAYGVVLLWKGWVWMQQRQRHAVADQPELVPKFRQLQAKTAELAKLATTIPDPKTLEEWRRDLVRRTEEKERLEAELASQDAAYGAAKRPATPAAILESLPADAALVDFLVYGHTAPAAKEASGRTNAVPHLLAFVVRAGRPVEALALGPAKPLGEAIEVWRKHFGLDAEGHRAAQALREQIWLPLERRLAGATSVLISPDGMLGRLPLAALPGTAPGTYLLEERALATLPVPQALPALLSDRRAVPGTAPKKLLLLGDVTYDSTPASASPAQPLEDAFRHAEPGAERRTFPPLLGAATEFASIKQLYEYTFRTAEGLTTLHKAEPSKARFAQESSRHLYLHLATHGFFSPPAQRSALAPDDAGSGPLVLRGLDDQLPWLAGQHPGLLSGLALAGANGEDGILTAEEVQTLDLRNVRLAVLSACETGLGEVAGGEGVLGLQRAFQVAGARTVVCSLWEVPDERTPELMRQFYELYFLT